MYQRVDTENCSYSLAEGKVALPEVSYFKDSSDIYTDAPIAGSEQAQALSSLNYRFEDLCDYLGIPRRLFHVYFTESPATSDGTHLKGSKYRGYLVSLTAVRGDFSNVLFHAQEPPADSNIVRGAIIDDEGNIECYAADAKNPDSDYTRLPITEKSAWLWATCPMKGHEKFPIMPDYVEVFNDALLQELLGEIDILKSRVQELEAHILPYDLKSIKSHYSKERYE